MSSSISREKIPWFPTVDAGLCDGCGICVDFCSHGVFARDDTSGRVGVIHPFGCVVGCNGCESLCPRKALTFPDLEAVQAVIRRFREEGETS
jgi:NAD-dependent dihydropyrimidine dehydrogenase PreA subunit